MPEVEVVVTVPAPFGVELAARLGLRTTLGVLIELLASAQSRVIISAPFVQGAEGLHAGPLGMALLAALRRGVRVDLITTGVSLETLNLDQLTGAGSGRFHVYRPRCNVEDSRALGSHAKFCLSDDRNVYIGSANLTQRGLSGNLELGALLHDRSAQQVAALVRALMESDYLVESRP